MLWYDVCVQWQILTGSLQKHYTVPSSQKSRAVRFQGLCQQVWHRRSHRGLRRTSSTGLVRTSQDHQGPRAPCPTAANDPSHALGTARAPREQQQQASEQQKHSNSNLLTKLNSLHNLQQVEGSAGGSNSSSTTAGAGATGAATASAEALAPAQERRGFSRC